MIVAFIGCFLYMLQKVPDSGRLMTDIPAGFFLAAILLLAVASHERNKVWKDEISLWEDAAQKSPLKVRPHKNLGAHYFSKGRLDDAGTELAAALS